VRLSLVLASVVLVVSSSCGGGSPVQGGSDAGVASPVDHVAGDAARSDVPTVGVDHPVVDASFSDVASPPDVATSSDMPVGSDLVSQPDQSAPPDMMCKKCQEVANLLLMSGGSLPDFSAINEFCPESRQKLIALGACVLGTCGSDCSGGISVQCGICIATMCGMQLSDCAQD
jgi:hypothetical protein